MSKVYLDTTRSGYGPDQCPQTLTVREMIELLEELDPDAEVFLRNDGGYTYGHITRDAFEEDWNEDEEE